MKYNDLLVPCHGLPILLHSSNLYPFNSYHWFCTGSRNRTQIFGFGDRHSTIKLILYMRYNQLYLKIYLRPFTKWCTKFCIWTKCRIISNYITSNSIYINLFLNITKDILRISINRTNLFT